MPLPLRLAFELVLILYRSRTDVQLFRTFLAQRYVHFTGDYRSKKTPVHEKRTDKNENLGRIYWAHQQSAAFILPSTMVLAS